MTKQNHKKVDGKHEIVSAYNKGNNWFVSTDTYDEIWTPVGYDFVKVVGKESAIEEAKRRGVTLDLETRSERKARLENV